MKYLMIVILSIICAKVYGENIGNSREDFFNSLLRQAEKTRDDQLEAMKKQEKFDDIKPIILRVYTETIDEVNELKNPGKHALGKRCMDHYKSDIKMLEVKRKKNDERNVKIYEEKVRLWELIINGNDIDYSWAIKVKLL